MFDGLSYHFTQFIQSPVNSRPTGVKRGLHSKILYSAFQKQFFEMSSQNCGETTILLLGETGVGKSTWINSFANFLEYDNFEAAKEGKTICEIPSYFTLADSDYQAKLIQVGSDENETTKTGQSATQYPRSYTFQYNERKIRLVDTPGVGDVRGVAQDKKNFERILDHIAHLDSLHAICILLKPNNARMSIIFRFCIKELLTHLHKDACKNIVFCFTNTRSTFYRPGDTLPALKTLLEENGNVNIPLNQNTIYCMDNEPVRFLYAVKSGVKFADEERDNYAMSWERSWSEFRRLIERVKNTIPHHVGSTICLNNARQNILALTTPLAQTTKEIQLNIVLIKQSDSKDSSPFVAQKVFITMEATKTIETVCTSCAKTSKTKISGYDETVYSNECHKKCTNRKQKQSKIQGQIGHYKLLKCSAFNLLGQCRICGCSWKVHMKQIFNNGLEVKENQVADKGELLKEYGEEQAKITSALVEFAKFLNVNAITPNNNEVEIYITNYIREEENKKGINPFVAKGMKEMLLDYKKQMQQLDASLSQGLSNSLPLSPSKLMECIDELYNMKHYGQSLRQKTETSKSVRADNFVEVIVSKQTKGKQLSDDVNTDKKLEVICNQILTKKNNGPEHILVYSGPVEKILKETESINYFSGEEEPNKDEYPNKVHKSPLNQAPEASKDKITEEVKSTNVFEHQEEETQVKDSQNIENLTLNPTPEALGKIIPKDIDLANDLGDQGEKTQVDDPKNIKKISVNLKLEDKESHGKKRSIKKRIQNTFKKTSKQELPEESCTLAEVKMTEQNIKKPPPRPPPPRITQSQHSQRHDGAYTYKDLGNA